MRFARENAYDDVVNAAAANSGVPAALLKAVIGLESEFNPRATALGGGDGARGGSYGLMQMSLATARALGFTGTAQDLYDPGQNIALGAKYLRDLLREAGAGGYGIDSAISAYNAGNSKWRRGDGPRVGSITRATPAEAQRVPFINQPYVNRVLELMAYFQGQGAGTAAPAYMEGVRSRPTGVVAQLEQTAADVTDAATSQLSRAADAVASAIAPSSSSAGGTAGPATAVLVLLAIGAGVLGSALLAGGSR